MRLSGWGGWVGFSGERSGGGGIIDEFRSVGIVFGDLVPFLSVRKGWDCR